MPMSAQADDLQIAGLARMSSVDWPGKLVATLFCQGCPWACPYCHNHDIIDPRVPGVVPFDQVRALLGRRHGLLDGVVFSGGEALRQAALVPAMREVRDAGYAIGLHTAGPYPARLREILEADLVDWVGLDIKALVADYPEVVGRRGGSGEKAWESLSVVQASGVDYEIRVTAFPAGPDAAEIGQALADRGVRVVALQKARAQGAPAGFQASGPSWEERFRAAALAMKEMGFERFIVRD
ncbi:MAG: anaerobic ribonucleoside-triphosphate reductase activating protein [Actinomycetaceae bacterium]|nr:anaerobic ribonucleoside-triphosphate reductase activating protein [Actinomycetaceae bacterium]MDU0971027.1 anaerobic ribonucleoside-triphosphate reductase activating protein [Actinomycetaceae bacterium]